MTDLSSPLYIFYVQYLYTVQVFTGYIYVHYSSIYLENRLSYIEKIL